MNGVSLVDSSGLGFTDAGSGPAVVFLHPTPLDRDYWRPLTKELAGIRAVVPDLRGHGVSELGNGLPVGGFSMVPDAPVLTMEKIRAVWNRADLVACLDETPFGCFLELEGDPAAIRRAMEGLSLGPELAELRSYPTLFREHGLA